VVLPDFALHVHPGETLALVGHTGSGTSSIAKLVARFYELQAGTLSIDGRDVCSLDLSAYRRQLGMVSANAAATSFRHQSLGASKMVGPGRGDVPSKPNCDISSR
jgi:ABC-type multidrug transport system fused ATPase/permease subunit